MWYEQTFFTGRRKQWNTSLTVANWFQRRGFTVTSVRDNRRKFERRDMLVERGEDRHWCIVEIKQDWLWRKGSCSTGIDENRFSNYEDTARRCLGDGMDGWLLFVQCKSDTPLRDVYLGAPEMRPTGLFGVSLRPHIRPAFTHKGLVCWTRKQLTVFAGDYHERINSGFPQTAPPDRKDPLVPVEEPERRPGFGLFDSNPSRRL